LSKPTPTPAEAPVGLARRAAASIPLIALVAANAVPLVGVIWFGWSVGTILALYWGESVIVGIYNVPRIAMARHPEETPEQLGKLFVIPFFVIHYGMFCAVHGLFVIGLGFYSEMQSMAPGESMAFVRDLFLGTLALPLVAMAVGHGVSFYRNYIRDGEYQRTIPSKAVMRPYGRIAVLHIAILAGGFGIGLLGSPTPMLAVLVVLKTVADAVLHLRYHRHQEHWEGQAT